MKRLMLLPLVLLAGCASGDYERYVSAQSEANRQAMEGQRPLLRLTAQPGQPITGLASVEVYAPTQAPVIQQSRPNEWAAVVGQGIGVIGTVAGIKAAGDAAIGLADSVGKSSMAGYPYIQTPQANVTTTTTNTSTATTSTSSTATDSGNTQTTTGSYNPATSTTTTTTGAPASP